MGSFAGPPSVELVDGISGCALLAGALGAWLPYFDGLALALSGCAFAGGLGAWARRRTHRRPGTSPESLPLPALGCALSGLAAYFAPLPAPLHAGRGLLVAAALLPLWWTDRVRRRTEWGPGS